MEFSPFTFRLRIPSQPEVIRVRSFASRDEMEAHVASLLAEWPECAAIEVLQADEVIDLFVQPRKAT